MNDSDYMTQTIDTQARTIKTQQGTIEGLHKLLERAEHDRDAFAGLLIEWRDRAVFAEAAVEALKPYLEESLGEYIVDGYRDAINAAMAIGGGK